MKKYSDEEIILVIEELINGNGDDQQIERWSKNELFGLDDVYDLIFYSNEDFSPEEILQKARELSKPILL